MKINAILAATVCVAALPAGAEDIVNYASYGGAYQEGGARPSSTICRAITA